MLRVFNGTYAGFQGKRSVGELFDYQGTKQVIIRILNTKLIISKLPVIQVNLVAQQVGKIVDYTNFYKEHTITDRLPVEGREPWDKNIKRIGEVINLRSEQDAERVPAVVTEIKSFEYDYTDLVVKYRAEIIEPWNDDQMDKAIQENRLSTFKVLQGSKGVRECH